MTNPKPDLDLSEFVGRRLTIAAGDYTFTLPADLPMPVLVRMNRAMQAVGRASETIEEVPPEEDERAADQLCVALEGIMTYADPPPPRPVRELFGGSGAALKLAAFLVGRFGEALTSKDS